MLQRIRAAAALLHPRTFLRTLGRVDQLVDATRELAASVESLRVQTEQLMAIQRFDIEHRDELPRLAEELSAARVDAHVRAAVAAAPIELDPFPHIVVDQWLPRDVYRRMIDGLPPPAFFAERELSRQRMKVPLEFAPEYSRRVWAFIAASVVGDTLDQALNEKFRPLVCDYVRSFVPNLPADVDLELKSSGGRIMLRRPGYTLPPHRDPKWGFVTGLVYLAREGDAEAYGTQLFRVRDDGEATNNMVHYVEPARCELVKTVPFRANTLMVFLNSTGAHAASIPADAPAGTERYLYQFRLGPSSRTIKELLSLMPPEQAALWAGAKSDRAAAAY